MTSTEGTRTERPRSIQVEGLTKRYPARGEQGPLLALSSIDLDVGSNEFVSLIGPSGCGKTTLLKIIDGLIPFDEGSVVVEGRPVDGPGPDRAVVFQNFALLPWLTVTENVEFGALLRKVDPAERAARSKELIGMVGLTGFENAYPSQLSGGMQQRVGLARALAVDPRVLLMDEPFGALDAQTRNLLQDDLLRIWEQTEKTVVFVTHAMDEAVFLSDRVVVMGSDPGRIVEVVDIDLPRPRTEAVRSDPRFVELSTHVWDTLRSMLVRGRSLGDARDQGPAA